MKKVLTVVLFILFLLTPGCIESQKNTEPETPDLTSVPSASETDFMTESVTDSATVSSENSVSSDVIEENRDYKIVAIYGGDITKYHYMVFNKQHDIMYEETILLEPEFVRLGNDILELMTRSGDAFQFLYFNINKNLISSIYNNPVLVSAKDDKIAYMDYDGESIELVVSDLFDKAKFYKTYKRDFAPVAVLFHDVTKAKFIDSSKLQITYYTGSDFKEVTETIDISK